MAGNLIILFKLWPNNAKLNCKSIQIKRTAKWKLKKEERERDKITSCELNASPHYKAVSLCNHQSV